MATAVQRFRRRVVKVGTAPTVPTRAVDGGMCACMGRCVRDVDAGRLTVQLMPDELPGVRRHLEEAALLPIPSIDAPPGPPRLRALPLQRLCLDRTAQEQRDAKRDRRRQRARRDDEAVAVMHEYPGRAAAARVRGGRADKRAEAVDGKPRRERGDVHDGVEESVREGAGGGGGVALDGDRHDGYAEGRGGREEGVEEDIEEGLGGRGGDEQPCHELASEAEQERLPDACVTDSVLGTRRVGWEGSQEVGRLCGGARNETARRCSRQHRCGERATVV